MGAIAFNPFYVLIGAPVLAFGLCVVALSVLLRLPRQYLIWDLPDRINAMHTNPTPRIGGLAIALAALCVLALLPNSPALAALAPLLMMTLVLIVISFFDDRWQLSPALRLTIHLAAALLIALCWVHGLLFPSLFPSLFPLLLPSPAAASWLANPISIAAIILAITWMTNLFNFMDGADGIAGGMAVFGFGSYAVAATLLPTTLGADANVNAIAFISVVIAGSAAGFLLFNFPPAKVFMGDAGAIPLGFLAGTLGIQGILNGLWGGWFPLVVFSPFIVDASATLAKRAWQRQKIWQGHREHYYQRLILSGWSHRRTALAYYFLMFLASASALATQSARESAQSSHVILIAWVVIYSLLIVVTERRLTNNKNEK